MLVTDILNLLPASLEWMVLFHLDALRPHAPDDTINSMFNIWEPGVQGDESLDGFSHVILTSAGVRLAPQEGMGLYNPSSKRFSPSPQESYAQRFAGQLTYFDLNSVDCLGAGELTAFFPAVVMWVKLDGRMGTAQAYFAQEPKRAQYDLLDAVGVKFVAGEWIGEGDGRQAAGMPPAQALYRAEFSLDLSKHILAGKLSGFSKTGYCNAFFLQQGSIGQTLQAGLTQAAQQRVEHTLQQGNQMILEMTRQAAIEPQPMWCQPPSPKAAFPFGDLVPLGFLLRALDAVDVEEAGQLYNDLSQYLLTRRSGDLWPFHGGDIPTATDSALILLGLEDDAAVLALERFADGQGGYYPQLWDQTGGDGRMQAAEWNRHWRQPDFATTCLVRAFRRRAGLPERTDVEYLEQRFHLRSGLFFANPYLVDYALALALQAPPNSEPRNEVAKINGLQKHLAGEILASLNPDHTFGSYDLPLSSALAMLSLDALGENAQTLGWRGQLALLAKLRLADILDDGAWQETMPFYSTMKIPGLDVHLVSGYLDRSRVITTAAIVLALGVQFEEQGSAILPGYNQGRHPRYACSSADEYITQFALPVYTTQADLEAQNPEQKEAHASIQQGRQEALRDAQTIRRTSKEVQ